METRQSTVVLSISVPRHSLCYLPPLVSGCLSSQVPVPHDQAVDIRSIATKHLAPELNQCTQLAAATDKKWLLHPTTLVPKTHSQQVLIKVGAF